MREVETNGQEPAWKARAKAKLEKLKTNRAKMDVMAHSIVASIQAAFDNPSDQLKLMEGVVRVLMLDSERNGANTEDLAHNRALVFIANIASTMLDLDDDEDEDRERGEESLL
jgi:hypothetical protein